MNFRKIFLLLITLLCFAALPLAEARGLQENYDLVQVLVLSRHMQARLEGGPAFLQCARHGRTLMGESP
jgi:hypothetical protein